MLGSRAFRRGAVVAAAAALAGGAVPAVRASLPGSVVPVLRNAVVDTSQHTCSPDDHPEKGLQGDVPKADQDSGEAKKGYNCGLALVGHAVLDGRQSKDGVKRSPTGNANMAWSGDCAYVSGDGVAVIDASDPAHPRHVRTLHGDGADGTIETLHALDSPAQPGRPARHLLVAGKYGIGTPSPNMPMKIYDVSKCDEPRELETFIWPENIHNLTISGNGRYVFATMPLQVLDLDPLFDHDPKTTARFLGDLSNDVAYPLVFPEPGPDVDDALPADVREARKAGTTGNLSHEAWPNFDGTRLYLGGVTAQSEVFTIVDITRWLQRKPDNTPVGPPEVISQRSGRGHSVRTGTLRDANGKVRQRLILHSEESVFGGAKGCIPEKTAPFAGPAEPWLTDITDEANPKLLSQFGLEINEALNCPAQLDSGVDASSHYHDLDSETDSHFAMVSMWNAGVRVFDVRNPRHPTEIAYFNPADVGKDSVVLDKAWGHVRYVARTGQIWFGTASGGFWIVELSQAVRNHFGVSPALPPRHPTGSPGTVGFTRLAVGVPLVDATPYYCTLGSVAARG